MGKLGTKAQIEKLEKENEGKVPVSDVLAWWFNPKNEKINRPFKGKDGQTAYTKGFHSVTSGFNDFVKKYYGVKDIQKFYDEAKAKKLLNTRPVKMGFMVYPYSEVTSGKADSLMAEMGLS